MDLIQNFEDGLKEASLKYNDNLRNFKLKCLKQIEWIDFNEFFGEIDSKINQM